MDRFAEAAIDRRPRVATAWFVTLAVVVALCQLAFGVLETLPRAAAPTVLVARADWMIDGEFVPLVMDFRPDDVPREMSGNPEFAVWRSWKPVVGATAGTVRSAPFDPPAYLAIPYQGFARENAQTRIYLRCEADGREQDVASVRSNTDWETVYLHLDGTFCRSAVRLVATSNGQHYVAVGTPFGVASSTYFAHTNVAPRIVVALLALLVLTCHLFVGDLLARRLRIDAPLMGGFAFLGCVGMAEIALFVAAPENARWISAAGVVVVVIVTFACAQRAPSTTRRWLVDNGRSLSLWALVCVAYVALVSSADSGGGSWAVNGLFAPLRWSSDNQLPSLVTDAFFNGTPSDQILFPPWHGFDRTPLLSGILLPLRAALLRPYAALAGPTVLPAAYMAVQIAVLTSWLPALRAACLSVGLRREATFVVGLAAVTPFFLFNSVYAWPKLLGGSFAVLAFCVLQRARLDATRSTSAMVLAAIFAACSYLAHASNAFVLVPIALFFVPTFLRQRPTSLLLGAAAFLLLAASWAGFVEIEQPHSNALLRYALSDTFGMDDRSSSLWSSLKPAYQRLGWHGWLDLKATEFTRQFVTLPYAPEMGPEAGGTGPVDRLRIGDFITLARTLGITSIAAGLLLVLPRRMRGTPSGPARRSAVDLATVGVAAIVLSVLVLLPMAPTQTLPYGAVMLIFVAGAAALHGTGPRVRIVAATVATTYCLVVWVFAPIALALRQQVGAEVALVEASVAFLLVAGSARLRSHGRTVLGA